MAYDPIAARYARAAFEEARQAGLADGLLQQLQAIGALIEKHAELRQLINNPDVDPPDKVGIIKRLLGDDWSMLLQSVLSMIIARGRVEYLPQIAEAFAAEMDADRGCLRVVVRSPKPLPEETLNRIRALLEKREEKQILLSTENDKELIAGVQIVLGHRVIDGSVKRQLAELRERLSAVRVA